MQTLWVILSLICRVVLLGLSLPVLLDNFPNYTLPGRVTQDWSLVVLGDVLALVAPLLSWRKTAFLAGILALGAHYYFRHIVPTPDLAYMGVAILFVLLPSSSRTGKTTFGGRSGPGGGGR